MYMCLCTPVYMHVCVHLYTCMYMCTPVYMHVYVYTCKHVMCMHVSFT